MLHWYRVVRLPHEQSSLAASSHSPLVRWRGSSPDSSLSPQQHRKMLWLGLAEAAPIIAGAIFSIYTDSKPHAIIAALVAFALSAIVCWCLRHQVPLTRIECSPSSPNQTMQPTAGNGTKHS